MNFSSNKLCPLPGLGIIAVSGRDAVTFLQGQLTCDMSEISPTTSRLTAYCTRKGRVLAVMRVLYWHERFLLVLPRLLLTQILTTLQSYRFIAKITLTDVSAEYQCSALFNHEFNLHVDTSIDIDDSLIARIHSDNAHIVISTHTYSCLLPENTWDAFLIKHGIVTILPETVELFTPHKLNLPALNAVSFSKGCYIGQEIIARTQHLGKPKHYLRYLVSNQRVILAPGTPVYINEQHVATVANSCTTDNGTQLLAVATDPELALSSLYYDDALFS